jgi:predicted O-methyltransferase YrrM
MLTAPLPPLKLRPTSRYQDQNFASYEDEIEWWRQNNMLPPNDLEQHLAGVRRKWGKDDLRLRHHSRYQDPAELERFVRLAQRFDVRSYLEIGSRFGDSFYAVMANLRPGAIGVSIDLPESPENAARLGATLAELHAMGQHCYLTFANSNTFEAHNFADSFIASFALYDLILIDGDHTYEGAAKDWHTYAPRGRVVAIHDIAAPDDWRSDGKPNGVQRFWRELKSMIRSDGFHTDPVLQEFATPGSNMGYGVVFR